MAKGDELLIVDGTDAHRKVFIDTFEKMGYVCSAVGGDVEARERLSSKFFPAALIDIDLGGKASGGLDLIRFVKERSSQTAIIAVTSRRSFEAAVDAFRLGVQDVVIKAGDQIPHLKQVVEAAFTRYHAGGGSSELLTEVRSVLDDAFGTMLELARNVYDEVSVAAMANFKPRILFVEADQGMVQALGALVQEKAWDIEAAINGGDGLDKSDRGFDLVVVRDDLPDLRGSMILKNIQARRAETYGLLYSSPGENGSIVHYNEGRSGDVFRPFTDPAQLIARIDAVVDELLLRQRDRSVIQAFRSNHDEFFRRYAELKLRIDRAID
jgi:DNA-binding response OmpR family regulator